MVASAFIEVLILETDAGEIPAIRGDLSHALTSTPGTAWPSLPSACAIGGLPNLIDRCASRSLTPQYSITTGLSQVVGHQARRHRTAIVHSRSARIKSLAHADTQRRQAERQVSMNLTRSTRDFPILSMDQTNTLSIAPDRIASISASSPERRS